jgi:hypothetical protein
MSAQHRNVVKFFLFPLMISDCSAQTQTQASVISSFFDLEATVEDGEDALDTGADEEEEEDIGTGLHCMPIQV